MDAAQAEATSIRNKESEEFLKSSKDYKDSADAVANAIAVLQEYYSSGSFVQSKEEPELGGAKTDIATTIMGMLEVAESDFTTLLAEAEASEKAAQASYDKLTKQRDFQKINHRRVQQEKQKLNADIGKLKKKYEEYQTTYEQLSNKYESAVKEKMLMKR